MSVTITENPTIVEIAPPGETPVVVEVTQQTVEIASSGPQGPAGPGGIEPSFSRSGALSPLSGAHRYYLSDDYTIIDVRASVGTPGDGSSIIVDVNLNGVSIYGSPGDRPEIAALAHTSGIITSHATSVIAPGDYLTVDIDQVGSSVSGANLTVSVLCHRSEP